MLLKQLELNNQFSWGEKKWKKKTEIRHIKFYMLYFIGNFSTWWLDKDFKEGCSLIKKKKKSFVLNLTATFHMTRSLVSCSYFSLPPTPSPMMSHNTSVWYLHSGLVHEGPWMLSTAASSCQAVLASGVHSHELSRKQFFVENTDRLKHLGVWFAENSMPNKKLEMLVKEMLNGRLYVSPLTGF